MGVGPLEDIIEEVGKRDVSRGVECLRLGGPSGLVVFCLYLAPVIFPTLETNGVHSHGRNRDRKIGNGASARNFVRHDTVYRYPYPYRGQSPAVLQSRRPVEIP